MKISNKNEQDPVSYAGPKYHGVIIDCIVRAQECAHSRNFTGWIISLQQFHSLVHAYIPAKASEEILEKLSKVKVKITKLKTASQKQLPNWRNAATNLDQEITNLQSLLLLNSKKLLLKTDEENGRWEI